MTSEIVLFSRLTEDLGITHSTAVIVLIALYFVIKWAVKNGITEAYTEITGKDTAGDAKVKEMLGLEKNGEV